MNGTVTVTYRPLETMDRLHIFLAESATLESPSVDNIGFLFSLPSRVIGNECAILEGYGIGRRSDSGFRLTDRGVDVLTTWNLLGKSDSVEIETTAKEWTLGPGSFSVPGTIRDFHGCMQRAKQSGITTTTEAKKFIRKRHELEIEIERFLAHAPKTWVGSKQRWRSHAEAIVERVGVAESSEAIDNLNGLLHSLLKQHNDDSNQFKDQKGSVVDAFNKRANDQRRENRRVSGIRVFCESLLLREWLSRAAPHLLDRFDDEPGAFVFVSSVPVFMESDKPRASSRPQHTARNQPQKSEGFFRSLFRWFTG